jgi:hypothetical protein
MLEIEDLFFLSPAPIGRSSTQPPARRAYAPEGEHGEDNFWPDSLTCLRLPTYSGPAMARQGGRIRTTISPYGVSVYY